ncbi:PhzF family phenazine biosynthesis protein [Tenacibaculum geojense]|uniref:PhzF family phenazine biosynthesis protein n=1 Tax=Tenacibaculum geojense TaxID=915352 RepID=A0ABW3JS47_9FLAO
MTTINYYLVDVFTSKKYGGNQLAVFIDFENALCSNTMLTIARELGFAEITFIKKNNDNNCFEVRIFTPEYEVPFAGHPSLGTAYIIAKHLLSSAPKKIILQLKHADIEIEISNPKNLEASNFIMKQAAPEFITNYSHQTIAGGLGINLTTLDLRKPIEEISTGLPYIIIPIAKKQHMQNLQLDAQKVIAFLKQHKKYKTNSINGLTTSLFFTCEETHESQNQYNTRMFLIENNNLIEDAATGSANGCFLAYLLKNQTSFINATVEQGFEMGRKSYIQLNGNIIDDTYQIKVGGQVVPVGIGKWCI